jgi:hypothetical protein
MNSHLTHAMITTNHQQLVRDAERARLAAEVPAGPSLLSRITTAVRSAAVTRRPASAEAPSAAAAAVVVTSPASG